MLIYYLKKSIYKFLSAISKEMFLKFQFQRLVGYRLNLKSPKTYNEKLQWLKLYYRDEKMSQCADKVEVRKYIKDKGLGDFLNEVYGVWGDVDDIEDNSWSVEAGLRTCQNNSSSIRYGGKDISFIRKNGHILRGGEHICRQRVYS